MLLVYVDESKRSLHNVHSAAAYDIDLSYVLVTCATPRDGPFLIDSRRNSIRFIRFGIKKMHSKQVGQILTVAKRCVFHDKESLNVIGIIS